MPKKRTLFDLYVTGKRVEVGDEGDTVPVWIQKVNSKEHESAIKAGNAKKSAILSLLYGQGSDEAKAPYYLQVKDVSNRDAYVDVLVNQQVEAHRSAKEDEVAASGRWKKENYLQGIVDAWNDDGLREEYLTDPEKAGEEAVRVHDEIIAFDDEVEAKLDIERRGYVQEFENMTEDELREEVVDRLIKIDAEVAWMDAYTKHRMYYAVRDIDDHAEYYFEDVDQIELLQPQTQTVLREAYNEISLDLTEGKDSPETQAT